VSTTLPPALRAGHHGQRPGDVRLVEVHVNVPIPLELALLPLLLATVGVAMLDPRPKSSVAPFSKPHSSLKAVPEEPLDDCQLHPRFLELIGWVVCALILNGAGRYRWLGGGDCPCSPCRRDCAWLWRALINDLHPVDCTREFGILRSGRHRSVPSGNTGSVAARGTSIQERRAALIFSLPTYGLPSVSLCFAVRSASWR